jgi:hypothetical protein
VKGLLLLITIITLNLPGSIQGQGSWRHDEMEIRVTFSGPREADELSRLHLSGDIYSHEGYAILYVTPGELEKVKSGRFAYEILKADLNEYSKDFWSTRDQYHTYDEIIQTINTLMISYPSICKKYDYGLSVEGRELVAVKISDNVNLDENEAEVMFDGGIHGDEIGGSENLVRFAGFLCESYDADPEITNLIDNREIWLYIMVNPDGRVNMVRYNSNGIDLNRDWGYMWDGDGYSPGYYSQVETRALRTCMMENQFVVHTSYHSGTEFLAYPWSYRPDPCPDQVHIHQLAGIYSSTSGYPDLPYEQGYTGMYPINGSSKDAAYGVMGSISWTIEISNDKQPPPSQIQYYYDINKPAMIAMIENAGHGINGSVTDATTGETVAATIFVNGYYPTYNDPVVGDYHKYLLAGSYLVKVVANGYQPMTQTAIIINDTFTTLDFALQKEYNHFAYRVTACQVPNTNFADEGRTYAALWSPDSINYSIGRSGWIILDMREDILDGPGSEVIVYEGDTDPEGFACFTGTSMDGPWTFLGDGMGTTTFDFSSENITEARYIRIIDDGDGQSNGDNAGFDLDAVEAPQQPQIIFLTLDCQIHDPSGNANGRIDAGENVDLIIALRNLGGMMMDDGQAYLNIDPEFMSVANPDANLGSLGFGDSIQLTFAINCSSFCPTEEILMMVLNITSNEGDYQQSFPVNFAAGAIVEDWETGSLTKFDWSVTGNEPWAINFLDKYEGAYSAKSGNVDDNQTSALQVTFDVIGYDDISFYRRVSSESGSDFLKFYIDDVVTGEWSGEQPWDFFSYQVKPGVHTFMWAYEKDNMDSQGLDGGWLDYIVFPSSNIDGTLKALANAIPYEFCGQGESQLGVYITGGTGNYNFSWTPSSTLSDPAIQFPVASPEATTLYSVSVNDGENAVSSDIEVILNLIPETPVIMQEGDSLISSTESGNQWFDHNGPISGATGQVFYPPVEDDYYALVTNSSGCPSDTSNVIHFLFTGIGEEVSAPTIFIYPNPFHEELKIIFLQKPAIGISIRITDILGRVMIYQTIERTDLQENIIISTLLMEKSLYLMEIRDTEGKILISKKLIKY